MDYLTEEELFELQHQDEMDALDDMDCDNEDIGFFMPGEKSNAALCERKSSNSDNVPNSKSISEVLTQSSASNEKFESPVLGVEEDKTPRKPEDEKENAPVPLSSKRKLSFSEDPSQSDYTECSESLIQERPKRTISEVSDDLEDSSISHSAKKTCMSLDKTVENFLRDCIGTQARSTFFDEVRTFSRDQQMITCMDGHRKYYNLNEEEDTKNLFPSFSQRTSSLLSIPIDVLKTQYFIMEEENDLRRQSEEPQQGTSIDEDISEEKDVESSLWVEKYRPISYMHLLSEEGLTIKKLISFNLHTFNLHKLHALPGMGTASGINRTLLQWLKLWDKVVFGKEKKAKKKPAEPKKDFPNQKFPKFGELIEDLDEHGRPHHKVAFLCGPPGLGKTTLAVIIAKHAGYNVVELNASDDRNPEAFRTSLEAATQMKAVLHEDHRPNCLVLDEIDGAPAPSINVLLSFIKSLGYTKGKQRKKGDIPLLTRPVICICNDQYSPALRPLRQLSLVLNFPPTTTSRLSSRLNEISMKEGLTADVAALNLLCEKSSNDIRSCLSTLQFIHRMKKVLKISDLDGLTIGQKDMQKSLFGVWNDVFHCTGNPSFDGIHTTIQSFGDYDKVYIGIFENYVNVKFKYRNSCHVWDGADWLCFGDIIQQKIAHQQVYFLLPYLPYPAVAFHMLFASNSYPQIAYPAPFYEYKSRSIQLSNTLTSMVKDMVSTLKSFLNPSVLLLDVFPFLQEIIKPALRPVNTQLYSEREKSELKRVIELMLSFNLNYRQERQQDGTYTYVLDPNIEELTKFSGIKSNKALTYSAKQMIAREVEVEQMRKGDTASQEVTVTKRQPEKTVQAIAKTVKAPARKSVVEKPMLDFFGRKIVESASTKKKAKGDPRDEEVWFHFKEGYSNAVRKTVFIKDLL